MPEVLVIDASAAVELVLGGPDAARLDRRCRGAVLAAPAHIDAEVLSALGRLQRSGELTIAEAEDALDDQESAPIQRIPIERLLRRAFTVRHNVSLLDALYVVVASDLDAALVTADRRLADACTTHQLCRLANW